jgi:hypothetical protein
MVLKYFVSNVKVILLNYNKITYYIIIKLNHNKIIFNYINIIKINDQYYCF